jgi:hypothetical protein
MFKNAVQTCGFFFAALCLRYKAVNYGVILRLNFMAVF